MKKKGFTLVELLAVIVMLAIILAIAVPGITGIINNATRSAFKSDAEMVLKQLEYEELENDGFDITTIDETNINTLNLSNSNYADLKVGLINNKPYIIIDGKNKWTGLSACGDRNVMTVITDGDTSVCKDVTQALVNAPVLATGMIPIKWNGTTWIDTLASDPNWYSYGTVKKEWANARTADGSMWVWIPRYIYRISSGWHTGTAGTIDIQFSIATDDTRGGMVKLVNTGNASDSNGTWTSHPSFTFGTTELTGIWVAKFEATGTISAIDSKPNVSPPLTESVGAIFDAVRSMETNSRYGWETTGSGIDTHLSKNVEWGAIVYLSKSIYGKNNEPIWVNPSKGITTGCAGDTATEEYEFPCKHTYETENGVKASTTGTIYGIYDISAGNAEYTAAYIDNGDANLTTYGNSVVNAEDKYKDIYTVTTDTDANNYTNSANKKGDAIYETSSSYSGNNAWYNNFSIMPSTSSPYFTRSRVYGGTTGSGPFFYVAVQGNGTPYFGFRPIIVINPGL